MIQLKTKALHRVKGCRKWLTEAEIARKYNSTEIAAAIVKYKLDSEVLSKSQVRDHPDLPGCPEMRQYLIYEYS